MSLHDSKDAIEQLYGDEVLKHFPNYETFWRRFIGNPNAEKPEPYEYIFPSDMGNQEKDKILKRYETIRMVHYSLFCHLAGAHYQLQELTESENVEDVREKYFRHWEHFEVGYMHLYSVFEMFERLWKIVLRLRKYAGFSEINAYLSLKHEHQLPKKWNEVRKRVRLRRNLPVHRSRPFAFPWRGKHYVALELHDNMLWSDWKNTMELVETTQILTEDTIESEMVINTLHEILIKEYGIFIADKQIRIDRGEK